MASEWRVRPLWELVDIFDGPHATPKKTASGPVFLGISNLDRGRLNLSEVEHLSENDYLRWTRRVEPRQGDVVFSYETRLGEAARIPAGLRCCLGRRMGLLRARPSEVAERFLLYAYLSPRFQATLRSRTVPGSTVDRISLLEMPRFPMDLPSDLDEQRAIAHVLGTLDDKIELNGRMNETLETIARALFKSWFVGLDLVRDKASVLIEEGVLEIGDGYRAKNVELGSAGTPFIRAGDLHDGIDSDTSDRLLPKSYAAARGKFSRTGDVVFTSKGTIGRFARVGEYDATVVYSPQLCFWRSLDVAKIHPAILYCWMVSDDFQRQVAAVAGQTDMAPYVSLRDQRSMMVPAFPAAQRDVGDTIAPLLARISENRKESKTLGRLRDTLLPNLLSGDLRLPLEGAA